MDRAVRGGAAGVVAPPTLLNDDNGPSPQRGRARSAMARKVRTPSIRAAKPTRTPRKKTPKVTAKSPAARWPWCRQPPAFSTSSALVLLGIIQPKRSIIQYMAFHLNGMGLPSATVLRSSRMATQPPLTFLWVLA